MRSILTLSLVFLTLAPPDAGAGCGAFGRRAAQRRAARERSRWGYGGRAPAAACYAPPPAPVYAPAIPAPTPQALPAPVPPPVAPGVSAAAPPVPVASGASDPNGFTTWLNLERGVYGLTAVVYDPDLETWAQRNNVEQAARGLGHYVMGPARRQNSAAGAYAQIGALWMASPAHRAALLDPSIRSIGLAGYGAWWTFSAY